MAEGLLLSLLMLFLLGAFHGINPGMGWLFAVALGMQEGRRKALLTALLPLAFGHVLAIGAVLLVAVAAGFVVSAGTLKWPVALLLALLGGYRLFRHRHPRWGGMRVGLWGLTIWSFLMASAHGAGLMVLPFFMRAQQQMHSMHHHTVHVATLQGPGVGVLVTLIHGFGYLLVTALAAWIVYEKLGLGLLRKAWVNLDLIWAVALTLTGVLTLML